MSYTYTGTPLEEWQDFVLWDEDSFDNPTKTRGDTHLGFLGIGVSGTESPYIISAPQSNYDGPSSYDYNVSAPPSIIGESASYGQFYGTSPTVSSTATSPLVGRDDGRYFGSFGACDNFLSPLREATESPLIDTTRERIIDSTSSLATTAGQVFNPHLASSYQAFSGRDMVASQILTSNTGTWAEPSFVGESIAEGDENSTSTSTAPIPIIRAQTQSTNGSFDSYDPLRYSLDHRTRAVTIPQPNGSRSAGTARSRFAPPMLSTSPIQRRSRSTTLSRSSSRNEQRKNRTSPSPTSTQSFGFVTMQMDSQSGRMAASTTPDGPQTRLAKGRKKALDPTQRKEAALMRIIGSCSNCRKRKEKCDSGTPCKACLKHYKGDLINHPCRNHALANLAEALLSNRSSWHPTNRRLQECMRTADYKISTDITYKIPLHFGFGLPMSLEVHPVLVSHLQLPCVHEHLVYSWPPESSAPATHTQPVLPALLTSPALSGLEQTLDAHLEHLVMSEFKAFPPYLSPLRILHKTYTFFRSLPKSSESAQLLLQALKLLVLVHVGGDITLPKQSESDSLQQLVRCTMNISEEYRPSPCLIRSQFGAVMPKLAGRLMKEVLSTLERILFSRNGDHWPIALATLIVVFMTIESIQYHAAKLPYHDAYDSNRAETTPGSFEADDSAVNTILASYKACFEACHTRLRPEWKGDLATTGPGTSTDQFVKSVREAIAKDGVEGYLQGKVDEKRFDEEDMGFFFDRLVAKLLLLDS